MKEMCCLSSDIYCAMLLYKEDAVLHAVSFQKSFQNKRNVKDFREFLPGGGTGSYGIRGRNKGEN